MMKSAIFRRVFLVCSLVIGLVACNSETIDGSLQGTPDGDLSPVGKSQESANRKPAVKAAYQGEGAEIFMDYCAACHQESGEGIEGAYPAFPKNEFVNGSPEEVIFLLLEGRAGMPGFIDDLSSEEITHVINHIRNSWGNKAGTVAKEQIEEAKEEIGEDDDAYSREGN